MALFSSYQHIEFQGQYNKNTNGLIARRMSLLELYREIVDEVFDFNNVQTYKLKPTFEGWEFQSIINGMEIPVYIYIQDTTIDRFDVPTKLRSAKNVVNFGFEIGNARISSQYTKSTYKDYIKILATVGEALDEYISIKHPDIVTFFSENKHGGQSVDSQKDNVYFKAIDRNKPSGYEVENVFDVVDKKLGIMIYKKDKFK